MEFEDVVRVVDAAVFAAHNRYLSSPEKMVLRGAWENRTYEDIAEGYAASYLKKDIGPTLWKLLSAILDQKVGKKNFPSVFRYWHEQQQFVSSQSSGMASLPLVSVPAMDIAVAAGMGGHRAPLVVDWGEMPQEVPEFCDRASELAALEHLLVDEKRQLVVVWGRMGIGKTALVSQLIHRVHSHFQRIVCCTLRHHHLLNDFLTDVLPRCGLAWTPDLTPERGIRQWLDALAQERHLVIIDDLDRAFKTNAIAGHFAPDCLPYGDLLRQIAHSAYPSSILCISRERPHALDDLENYGVCNLQLQGLAATAIPALFPHAVWLETTTSDDWASLQTAFDGNPQWLLQFRAKLIRLSVEQLGSFLHHQPTLSDQPLHDLTQQIQALTEAERQVLYWLALAQQPLDLARLRQLMVLPPSMDVMDSLINRSLCSVAVDSPGFCLSALVTQCALNHLVTTLISEVEQESLNIFNTHPLLQADAAEYIQDQQRQQILQPLLVWLKQRHGHPADLEQKMYRLLAQLRQQTLAPGGYGAGNLLNLCSALPLNLNAWDLSGLTIYEADLQRLTLHGVNLTRTEVSRCVFNRLLGAKLQLAFDATSTLLAVGNEAGKVLIWRVENGHLHSFIRQQGAAVKCLAFSPDGQQLAIGTLEETIQIWSLPHERWFPPWPDESSQVLALSYSPDDAHLASGHENGEIRIWDRGTGRCLHTLPGHGAAVHYLRWSKDLALLARYEDNTLRLWPLPSSAPSAPIGLALAPEDFKTVLVLPAAPQSLPQEAAETVVLVSWIEGRLLLKYWLTGQPYWIGSMVVPKPLAMVASHDGRYLASSHLDRIMVWDIQARDWLHPYLPILSPMWSLQFSPDSRLLVGSCDHQLRFWDVATGKCLRTLQGHPHPVRSFSLSQDGALLICSHQDHHIRLWQVNAQGLTTYCLQTLFRHTSALNLVVSSGDNHSFAAGSEDAIVWLWQLQAGQWIQQELPGRHTGEIRALSFSPSPQRLASGGTDGAVWLWQVTDGQPLQCLRSHQDAIESLAFSPGGQVLASGSADCTIRIWQLEMGESSLTLSGHRNRIHTLCFHPDNSTLLSGSYDGSIRIWDLKTADCLTTWHPPENRRVHQVYWRTPQQPTAIVSDLRTLEVWDCQQDQCLYSLAQGPADIWQVSLSPCQTRLISATKDEVIQIWSLHNGSLLQSLRVDRPYEGMNIRGIQGLTPAEKTLLVDLGAIL